MEKDPQSTYYSLGFDKKREHLEYTLEHIFSNLFYTWEKDMYGFIDKLDSYNWHKTKSPSVIIHSFLENNKLENLEIPVRSSIEKLQNYLAGVTWFDEHSQQDKLLSKFHNNPIIYFSAEYGLVDWIQIYSGGLGVLAGDFVKEASDFGVPMIGVGIFYHNGYFHQDIDSTGMQREHYIPQDPAASMLKLIRDKEGNQLEVYVKILDHNVYIRAWEMLVGRNKIILLDTNFEKNEIYEDRMITSHLYGGDDDTRIRQEIILGIGGYRFVRKMGINPQVIHLNEGHASFVIFQKLLEENFDGTFTERLEKAKLNILFTNHTLNAAGNDKFEYDLFEKYFAAYEEELNASINDLFLLGKSEEYAEDKFAMTILGFKGSAKSNGVSLLHGEAAKKLWPDYKMEAITNGVHMPTWIGSGIQKLIEKYVDQDWQNPLSVTDWHKIDDIPAEELWEEHKQNKVDMIDRINNVLGTKLDDDKLTVVWTRRFAAYKRPQIFLNDLNRLSKIVNNLERPVQFLIGGKAHPQDMIGKNLLKEVLNVTMKDEFKDKVVFLNGYNWNLARYVVSGSDVWLNNPERFEEASGTSGMKSGANGVLQFTTLDGWTDEVDWSDKGWVLPQENINEEIYNIIERDIAPTYYDSDLPIEWIKKMKNTMKVCLTKYNTGRMLKQYIEIYKELA